MTKEATRPIILQGGRLCGLPNVQVMTRLDETEFVDDVDSRVYMYAKHHKSSDGIDVFRIVGVRPPPVSQQDPKKAKKKVKKKAKKASKPRDEKD